MTPIEKIKINVQNKERYSFFFFALRRIETLPTKIPIIHFLTPHNPIFRTYILYQNFPVSSCIKGKQILQESPKSAKKHIVICLRDYITESYHPLCYILIEQTFRRSVHSLKQAVSLLWTFSLPWDWAYHGTLFHPGVAQFTFGFYSVMLTSTVLGVATMILFKPRSWCVYCPMGTMTQLICKAKSPKLNDSK